MRPTVVVGMLAALWAPSGLSCSCMDLPIESLIDRAAYVFRGRITRAELVELEGSESNALVGEYVRFQVEVISTLKGVPSELDEIYTPSEGSACGIPVVIGLDYVFFLSEDGVASLCGGTLAKGVTFGSTGNWFDFVKRYGLAPEL